MYRVGVVMAVLLPWSAINGYDVKDLQLSVKEFLHSIEKADRQAHIGVELISLDQKTVIYQKNAYHLFTPASVTKLFTGALALKTLGPDYQFETTLMMDGSKKGSTLNGSLYLKGSGDPSLTVVDLEKLIASVARAGIKTIKGSVHIDVSTFDDALFAAGYFLDDLEESWNSPVSALMVNRKPVIAEANRYASWLCHKRIACNTQELITSLLKKEGIALNGTVSIAEVPVKAKVVARHVSEPLAMLLKQMEKSSDNLYADAFFKKIASVRFGVPGTWQKGSQALKSFLYEDLGISPSAIIIEDGSGRSRYNAIAPHHVVSLLRWIAHQPYFNTFLESLPLSAVDGTLKERMLEIPMMVRAKTGTLPGVSALAGYVTDGEKNIMAFCAFTNGFIPPLSMPGTLATKCSKQEGVNFKVDFEDEFCKLLVLANNG